MVEERDEQDAKMLCEASETLLAECGPTTVKRATSESNENYSNSYAYWQQMGSTRMLQRCTREKMRILYKSIWSKSKVQWYVNQ